MARRRRVRAGRRALRGLHGRARGARAARRRPAVWRQRRPHGGRRGEHLDQRCAPGTRRVRPARGGRRAARARRHRDESVAGRQRGARRLARGGSRRRRLGGPAALALGGRTQRACAAHTDDERDQRRRARRQRARAPGIHGDARRGRVVLRRAPLGCRGLPRAEGAPAREGLGHRRGRRRRIRARDRHGVRGPRMAASGDREGGPHPRRRRRPGDGPGDVRTREATDVTAWKAPIEAPRT